MRPSRVRQRWAQGMPALVTMAAFTDPAIAELISLMGFDCIWIDLEHQSITLDQAAQMFRAARVGGADVMARPGKGEFMQMGRLLESGATGILYPRCDDAAEAEEVVRWAKFAPLGERGCAGTNPDVPYDMIDRAQYVREANQQTWLAIQIESPAAVKHARAIAEVEGVDVVFFGLGDFAVLSDIPGQFEHAKVTEAMHTICRETLAAGKRFGIPGLDLRHTRLVLDMGASLVCSGVDLIWVKRGLEELKSQYGPLGFGFDRQVAPARPVVRPHFRPSDGVPTHDGAPIRREKEISLG
jgi:4-hydroxy-2-oxoheptanedioate aldolase